MYTTSIPDGIFVSEDSGGLHLYAVSEAPRDINQAEKDTKLNLSRVHISPHLHSFLFSTLSGLLFHFHLRDI